VLVANVEGAELLDGDGDDVDLFWVERGRGGGRGEGVE
jgi:hypothetical protein